MLNMRIMKMIIFLYVKRVFSPLFKCEECGIEVRGWWCLRGREETWRRRDIRSVN